jgi:hypothetical protein
VNPLAHEVILFGDHKKTYYIVPFTINYFKTGDDFISIFFKDRDEIVVCQTLKDTLRFFSSLNLFCETDRCYAPNLHKIIHHNKDTDRLIMENEHEVLLSQAGKQRMYAMMTKAETKNTQYKIRFPAHQLSLTDQITPFSG